MGPEGKQTCSMTLQTELEGVQLPAGSKLLKQRLPRVKRKSPGRPIVLC